MVDLFAGCGGLTLGVAQAARSMGYALDVALAIDSEPAAVAVYRANFPNANVQLAKVDDFFDGALGAELTPVEVASASEVGGDVSVLVGGPPCQGHSNLNNHTRRDDPKNTLYLRMARAAEVLAPDVVLIENVPAVQHDRLGVVAATRAHLETLGYTVAEGVVRLDLLGVAQRRRRHVLIASRDPIGTSPSAVLERMSEGACPPNDLEWAIGDLVEAEPVGVDAPPRASEENLSRMMWLLENDEYDLPNNLRPPCHQNDHSYKSMYGRLRWSEPAQTLTSGYGSIGQGRFMHPDVPRALTAHEAARIQGFPDYFDFTVVTNRSALATMIGNAVPPALAGAAIRHLLAAVSAPHQVSAVRSPSAVAS